TARLSQGRKRQARLGRRAVFLLGAGPSLRTAILIRSRVCGIGGAPPVSIQPHYPTTGFGTPVAASELTHFCESSFALTNKAALWFYERRDVSGTQMLQRL